MICSRKYFSPSSANDSLVLVKRVVADVMRYSMRLSEVLEMLEAAEKARDNGRIMQLGTFFSAVAGQLRSCLEELDELGIVMTDSALGIIEFPCIADGTEVRLCWRHGEQAVMAWHEVGESYPVRRPIHTLPVTPDLEPIAV